MLLKISSLSEEQKESHLTGFRLEQFQGQKAYFGAPRARVLKLESLKPWKLESARAYNLRRSKRV